jgi:PAS domain S-box-containing protein
MPDDIHSTRIAAIRKSGLLDRRGREQFDLITEHVRVAMDCPVAIISIVDEDRQVFAGHCGLPSPWDELGETPMTHSFCQHVVDRGEPLIVSDANVHALVRTNHAITDLGVTAYLGVPIRLPSAELVGALAAIDTAARDWTERDLATLETLAKVVEREIAVGVSELKYRRLFEDMQEGYYTASAIRDQAGELVDIRLDEVNPAFERLTGLSAATVVGKTLSSIIPSVLPDMIPAYEKVLETGEVLVHANNAAALGRWYENRIRRLDADRIASVFTDVSDRKQREVQDAILHQEMAHRLKNTFATVLAIASQTFRPMEDRTYVDAFSSRLVALSAAHDILIQKNWGSSPLSTVVSGVMDNFVGADRIRLEGPELDLGPKATLSTSLILHELATNAAKYGALSNATGTVDIMWSVADEGDEPAFIMKWREADGPHVVAPTRKGFGSRLIQMGLVGSGGVEISYPPAGLQATMSAPLRNLQSDT